MRIKDKAGNIYEGPEGPVPAGYELAESPLSAGLKKAEEFINPISRLGQVYRGAGSLAKYSPAATVAGGVSSLLGRTPEQTEKTRQAAGNITRDIAMAGALPFGEAPLLGRMAMQGGLSGTQAALQKGKIDVDALKAAGIGAALQPLAEIPFLPFRMLGAGKAAKAATKSFEEETASLPDKAGDILMNHYKKIVPSWSKLPGGVKGVQEAVIGEGMPALHSSFDKAMKEASKKAAGQVLVMSPKIQEALDKAGVSYVVDTVGNIPVLKVGAEDAMNAMVGKGLKFPAAYRAIFSALDNKGITDPAARAEYKAGMSLYDAMAKSKALQGGSLNLKSIEDFLTDPAKIKAITQRGIGDYFRGPFAELRNIPRPVQPDIKTIPNPAAGHPIMGMIAGGGIGGGLGHLTGMGAWPGHIAGDLLGLGLSKIPNFGAYSAPGMQGLEQLLGQGAGLLGAGISPTAPTSTSS